MTPPTLPPSPNERQRATPDFFSRATGLQRRAIATTKIIFCAIAISEAATLIARIGHQVFASPTSFSSWGGDGSSYSLRLTLASAIGCFFGVLGGCIRVWCHHTLGSFFTWELALRDGHKLITQGPYRIVRHPSYTGFLFLTTGDFLLLYSRGSLFCESGLSNTIAGRLAAAFATVCMGWVWGGIFQRTQREDIMLKNEFGKEWDEWAQKTRYRLIPYVY